MSESILFVGTIVLVATLTSVLFVLLVQRRNSLRLSARQVDWENTYEHSLQMWEGQQEERVSEIERSLTTSLQRIEAAWKAWEVHDASFIASTAQRTCANLLNVTLDQEIARLPHTDEVPLKTLD